MLNESINDKNILKAIIMVGSAGAGKSSVIEDMGINNNFLKINSDYFFEHLTGGDFDMNVVDDVVIDILDNVRKFSKILTINKLNNHIDGLLSVIIDTTGSDYNKVLNMKNILEEIGYVVYCIYVDVSLNVALKRNINRSRKIKDSLLVSKYGIIKHNVPLYKSLFGDNFYYIDNDKHLSDNLRYERSKELYIKISKKILNSKISKNGQDIVNFMKLNKYKYLSDFLMDKKYIKKF